MRCSQLQGTVRIPETACGRSAADQTVPESCTQPAVEVPLARHGQALKGLVAVGDLAGAEQGSRLAAAGPSGVGGDSPPWSSARLVDGDRQSWPSIGGSTVEAEGGMEEAGDS